MNRTWISERTHDQPCGEDVMEPTSPFKIQLESALLCLDLACNAIFDGSLARQCPACGGADTYPVAVWLDRAEGATRRREQPAVVAMSVRAA